MIPAYQDRVQKFCSSMFSEKVLMHIAVITDANVTEMNERVTFGNL